MKKVLYIANIPAPYRVAFFNELSKSCELTVAFELTAAGNRDKNWRSMENYHFRPVFMEAKYRKTEGAFCPEVLHYIKEYAQDIIVVGGYSTPTGMISILYMKLHHIPFWLNCDGGMIKADNIIKKKMKTFFIGSASRWLSTGKMSDKYLIHYGAKRENIYHYPFTSVRESDIIRVGQKEKRELRKKLGIQENRMVLYVGSFIWRKGIDVLLRAGKNMSNTAIVLVGGDDISLYQDIMDSNLECNVYPLGFKNKEEIKLYYQAASVFVLPTREDIWGLVINEAMACGLPVITTNKCVAGLEMVEDGVNGYIVPAEDSKILADRIETILQDEKLREAMGENSLGKIKDYTIEKMAERHGRILGIR